MDDNKAAPTKAVALKYNQPNAPTVTASGVNEMAQQIKHLAQASGVLVHHNPQLAEMLAKLELGQQIPPELYRIIAELIAYAYLIDGRFPEQWQQLHDSIDTEV
ncbi:EscU/YscU/HrcU family type III secretion system export apparatus switch protein [Ferrimonas lipolytica]|uniref:Flagellar biosynthetic protein FlhB n=1 Tax=Ferrimonas lipolytica TaxID=2724191 RepID=A0A6H1U9D7_9GAMM|nr:EscU/YscU/HrcU family type III secretion system export apparatus switch protein [Ferrimonas lipolytica]QIZ75657.1 flagellar biosynthesis protein FlhB [Ferrimonas lipolytica]